MYTIIFLSNWINILSSHFYVCCGVNMILDIFVLLASVSVIGFVSSECYDSNIQYSSPSGDIKTIHWRQVSSQIDLVNEVNEVNECCYKKMSRITSYLYLWLSRSPGDCNGLCNMFEECSHWTWASGSCHLKSGQFWSKTPHKGSISGTAGQMCLEQPVRGKMWCVVINHFFVVDLCCVQVVSVDMRGQRLLYNVYLLITGN